MLTDITDLHAQLIVYQKGTKQQPHPQPTSAYDRFVLRSPVLCFGPVDTLFSLVYLEKFPYLVLT